MFLTMIKINDQSQMLN